MTSQLPGDGPPKVRRSGGGRATKGGNLTRRIWALLLVGALSTMGLAACGDDDDEATGTGTATTTEEGEGAATRLDLVAKDYSFEGIGATVEGGVVEVTLRNEGDKNHEASFLEIGDKSVDEALEALGPAFTGEPFPNAPKLAGGVSGVEPGQTATTTLLLPAGTYALICALSDEESEDEEGGESGVSPTTVVGSEATTTTATGGEGGEEEAPPHFVLGMRSEFEAEGGEGATLPDTGASITTVDYGFELEGLKAGENEVVYTNTGRELHHFVLSVFEEGVTEEQALDAFQRFAEAEQSGSPPPEGTPEPEDVADTIPLDRGFGQTVHLDLEANRVYIILCFISDRSGGPPHAFAHRMVDTFTVT